ncbi:MAG: protein kinase [Acidobacteriota bacterium]
MSASPPRQIGPYLLQDLLGRGGMGEVWSARDVRLDRRVAIKHVRRDQALDPTLRERFRREAWAAARIAHPAVVPVFDVLEDSEGDWIVMELVEGPSLRDRVQTGEPLPLGELLRFGRHIAQGLAAAHAKGLVHRDLKTENVILADSGHAKILDFGLVKHLNEAREPGAASLTESGAVMGTARAMSPEQARGLDIDPRSDLFSFGTLLYEAACGRSPFLAETSLDTLTQVVGREPTPLSELRPELPDTFCRLVGSLHEKARERRPASADEVARALDEIAADWSASHRLAEAAGHPRGVAGEATVFDGSTAAGLDPPAPGAGASLPQVDDSEFRAGANRVRPRVATAAAVGLVLAGSWLWWSTPGGRGDDRAEPPQDIATSTAPAEAYPLFRRGQQKLLRFDRTGSLDEALDLFERALAADPRHAPSLAGLAEGSWLKFIETRDAMWLDRAEVQARSAVDADPHLAAGQRTLGLALAEKGEAEASSHLETALALDPSSGMAHWADGVHRRRRGDLEGAIDRFTEAASLAPDRHLFLDELGGALFAASRFEEAESALRRSLELTPDGFHARRSLAGVLQLTGRSAEATAELQRALEIRPSATLYGNLGGVLFYRGLYRQAAKAFESALDIGGAQHYQHWANAGDAYRFIDGARAKRDEAFRQALRLADQELAAAPDDFQLKSRILTYLAKMDACRDMDDRRQEWVFDLRGSNAASVYYRAALAAEICRERDEALRWLQRALDAGYPRAAVEQEPELAQLRLSPGYSRLWN